MIKVFFSLKHSFQKLESDLERPDFLRVYLELIGFDTMYVFFKSKWSRPSVVIFGIQTQQ